jgi:hypothetical protein
MFGRTNTITLPYCSLAFCRFIPDFRDEPFCHVTIALLQEIRYDGKSAVKIIGMEKIDDAWSNIIELQVPNQAGALFILRLLCAAGNNLLATGTCH